MYGFKRSFEEVYKNISCLMSSGAQFGYQVLDIHVELDDVLFDCRKVVM